MLRKSVVLAATVSLLVVVPFSQSFAAKPDRNEAPAVTAFDVEPASESPVPILTFTATDSDGTVAGYLVTESSSEPSAGDPGWSATAPATYTTSSVGLVTLYAWAKDDKDAVSNSMSDTVDIPDPQDQIIADLQAAVAALQADNASQQTEIAALQSLLQHFSRTGNDVYISGANLHVESGSGATETVNGFGNLIIGYNELRGDATDNRGGSHNLILGRGINYLSFGGISTGLWHEMSGMYASTIGGRFNAATGTQALVLGGDYNDATGSRAIVVGGNTNLASGTASFVSGGGSNIASADYASVSGGAFVNATGRWAWAAGGTSINAAGQYSVAVGGNMNQAISNRGVVIGGDNNTVSGEKATLTGGYWREALGLYDWVAGSLWEDQ